MIEPILLTIDYYYHSKNDYVLPQFHNSYELVWYKNGSGEIVVENDIYRYEANDLMVISPYQMHEEKNLEKTDVMFILFNLNNVSLDTKLIKYDESIFKEIKPLLEKITKVYEEKEVYFADVINGILIELVAILLRHYYTNKTNSNDCKEVIKMAKKYISKNSANDINFEQLAQNFGYSYDRFRHIFTKETGVGLKAYQLECRLSLAKKLLLNESLSIQAVATRCGFNSLVRFTTYFTEQVKMTPSKYRSVGLSKVPVVTL